MKLFTCQKCGQLLYFENTHCEHCGSPLGFLPVPMNLLTLVKSEAATYGAYAHPAERYRYCRNAEHDACNWLIPEDEPVDYCRACQLNRNHPQP